VTKYSDGGRWDAVPNNNSSFSTWISREITAVGDEGETKQEMFIFPLLLILPSFLPSFLPSILN
jgi:hypothetical protein